MDHRRGAPAVAEWVLGPPTCPIQEPTWPKQACFPSVKTRFGNAELTSLHANARGEPTCPPKSLKSNREIWRACDLPQALQDKYGGWQSAETAKAFGEYGGLWRSTSASASDTFSRSTSSSRSGRFPQLDRQQRCLMAATNSSRSRAAESVASRPATSSRSRLHTSWRRATPATGLAVSLSRERPSR
jgi:hypothetical protein